MPSCCDRRLARCMSVWKAHGGIGRAVRARQRAPQQATMAAAEGIKTL